MHRGGQRTCNNAGGGAISARRQVWVSFHTYRIYINTIGALRVKRARETWAKTPFKEECFGREGKECVCVCVCVRERERERESAPECHVRGVQREYCSGWWRALRVRLCRRHTRAESEFRVRRAESAVWVGEDWLTLKPLQDWSGD